MCSNLQASRQVQYCSCANAYNPVLCSQRQAASLHCKAVNHQMLCSSLHCVLFHASGVYMQATAHEDLKRLLGKAQAIDELESTIPSFIEKLMPYNYPAFVHVLRVSTHSIHYLRHSMQSTTCHSRHCLVRCR